MGLHPIKIETDNNRNVAIYKFITLYLSLTVVGNLQYLIAMILLYKCQKNFFFFGGGGVRFKYINRHTSSKFVILAMIFTLQCQK